jgi:2-keto-3-deoxy-L-rhamnonate aldolase RhmA
MTTQHHTSFTKTIAGSARRLFRSSKHHGLLASSHIDARTMRDIGVNPLKQVGVYLIQDSQIGGSMILFED